MRKWVTRKLVQSSDPDRHHAGSSDPFRPFLSKWRTVLFILGVLALADLGHYGYVRATASESGFSRTTAYTTHHYQKLYPKGIPTVVLAAHWPLMKIEGLLRGRRMMITSRDDIIIVHDPG